MVVTKREDRILIKVDFDQRERLRKIVVGVKWDPVLRCWEAPATISTFRNLRQFDPEAMDPIKMPPSIRAWYNELLNLARRIDELQKGTCEAPTFPEDFTFAVKPFRHQLDAIAFCINLPKTALWLDMGLGKTFTSINVARYRNKYQGVNKVLVVAPRSLLHQWVQEIHKYVPEEHDVFVIEGTPKRKNKKLRDAELSEAPITFVIITYESLLSVQGSLKALNFGMFILDESTKIKNPKAVRSKATVSICQSIPYGVELTGLAYLNNPIDLFSQFLALDPTVYGNDVWRFGEHYIDFVKTSFGRAMRGIRHLDELKRRAYFIAFSKRKEDCLDLPEKVYTVRTLPMYDTQKVWYDKVSQEIGKTINDPDIEAVGGITNVLTQLEKLQQITAGFLLTESHEVIWFDSPKYAEVCDIIQGSSEQFIIWCRHIEAMKRIQDALENRQIESVVFNRFTHDGKRVLGKKRFKEGKLKVLICQITSESKGLDLTSKTGSVNAIYLENSFSIDERHQSESRQHRIGMKGTATYTDLLLEDTIDEHVLNILRDKLKISEYIAKHGLTMIMGKGGSVSTRRSKSKKVMPTPEDPKFNEPEVDTSGCEGFED